MTRGTISWDDFERNLSHSLEALGGDEFLVVEAGQRYVQFASLGDQGIRAEASSNEYLAGTPGRISDRDSAAMAALGWHLPDRMPPKPRVKSKRGGSPNFYVDAPAPIDYASLARMAVATLRLIFEIQDAHSLRYSAGGRGGQTVRFPDLGIPMSGR